MYETLRNVVLKHLGLEDIVEAVLEKMGNVNEIILVGDYAEGKDSGNIEIFNWKKSRYELHKST